MGAGTSNQAVMAVDTSNNPGTLYWYYQPQSDTPGQFAVSTDTNGYPIVWFTDDTFGTYAIGVCGVTGHQPCFFWP